MLLTLIQEKRITVPWYHDEKAALLKALAN
jgi:hypothetical protein